MKGMATNLLIYQEMAGQAHYQAFHFHLQLQADGILEWMEAV
jgi:hypothetical protein